jgi:hypothetical protein
MDTKTTIRALRAVAAAGFNTSDMAAALRAVATAGPNTAAMTAALAQPANAEEAEAWSMVVARCPRRQCRGRVPHSLLVHWFGWMRQ